MPGGVYNLQIKVKEETRDIFRDTFERSGADNNAVFLKMLLDSYVSGGKTEIKEVPYDNPNLILKLEAYENHPTIQGLFQKYKGQTIKFYDNKDKKREVTVNSPFDVFEIIMSKTYSD